MSGNNWWVASFPASMPGGTTTGGGGGYSTDVVSYRDPLDAKRVAAGFAPGASYPDGYLGSMSADRQEPKLNDKSYVRGVHVGEKQPEQHYFWTDVMNPDMGLDRQAASVYTDVEGGMVFQSPRFSPQGDPVELLSHNGKFAPISGPSATRDLDKAAQGLGIDTAQNPVTVVDPSERAQWAPHMPRWSGVFQA
jgi:hypothetical protein